MNFGEPEMIVGEADDTDTSSSRFPRTQRLLSPEYGDFLGGVIQALEDSKCYTTTRCSAAKNTPWQQAFELVYDRIATQYEKPTGKNAVHKFRDKITALWKAMDDAVLTGMKHGSHPMYRQAIQQWHVYKSLDKTARGRPPTADIRFLQSIPKSPPAPFPTHKENTLPALRTSGFTNTPTISRDMHQGWKQAMARLESILTAQLPSKLPSPLSELHRLYTRSKQHERQLIAPVFYEEIGKHLQQVTNQANMTSQSYLIPGMLEGLDELRQCEYDDHRVTESIDACYRGLLQKYLSLVHQMQAPHHRTNIPPPPTDEDLGVNGPEHHSDSGQIP